MKKLTIVPIVLLAAMLLALAGCSQAPAGTPSQPVEKDTLIGYWQLDSATSIGVESYLEFDENDSAQLIIGDSFYEGTWSVSDGSAKLAFEGLPEVGVVYTGEKVVIGGDEASRLVYAKGDESLKSRFVDDGTEGEEDAATVEGETTGAETEVETAEDSEPTVDEVTIVDEVIEDIAPITLVDDGTCTITATGKGTDFTSDPCYRLYILNKTDQPLYFTIDDEFTVAGKKVEAGLGDVVEPEEEIDALMYFSRDDLGGGPELLADVNGTINVEVDETYAPVASYAIHVD